MLKVNNERHVITVLVIHAPRRGLVEIWKIPSITRLGIVSVGEDARLLSVDCRLPIGVPSVYVSESMDADPDIWFNRGTSHRTYTDADRRSMLLASSTGYCGDDGDALSLYFLRDDTVLRISMTIPVSSSNNLQLDKYKWSCVRANVSGLNFHVEHDDDKHRVESFDIQVTNLLKKINEEGAADELLLLLSKTNNNEMTDYIAHKILLNGNVPAMVALKIIEQRISQYPSQTPSFVYGLLEGFAKTDSEHVDWCRACASSREIIQINDVRWWIILSRMITLYGKIVTMWMGTSQDAFISRTIEYGGGDDDGDIVNVDKPWIIGNRGMHVLERSMDDPWPGCRGHVVDIDHGRKRCTVEAFPLLNLSWNQFVNLINDLNNPNNDLYYFIFQCLMPRYIDHEPMYYIKIFEFGSLLHFPPCLELYMFTKFVNNLHPFLMSDLEDSMGISNSLVNRFTEWLSHRLAVHSGHTPPDGANCVMNVCETASFKKTHVPAVMMSILKSSVTSVRGGGGDDGITRQMGVNIQQSLIDSAYQRAINAWKLRMSLDTVFDMTNVTDIMDLECSMKSLVSVCMTSCVVMYRQHQCIVFCHGYSGYCIGHYYVGHHGQVHHRHRHH